MLFLDLLGRRCACEQKNTSCRWSYDDDEELEVVDILEKEEDIDCMFEVEILEKGLRLKECEFGHDSIECVPSLTNLARVWGIFGQFQSQKEALERTLRIVEKCYGPEHVVVAEILAALGTLYGKLGDTWKERDLLDRALRILALEFGSDNATIATLEAFDRSLSIEESLHGPNHPQIVQTRADLAWVSQVVQTRANLAWV